MSNTAPTALRLSTRVGPSGVAELPVATSPPPLPLPAGDPRIAGIGVYALSAHVVCDTGGPGNIG